MSPETGSFWGWGWGWGCRVALQVLCMCGGPQASLWWSARKVYCRYQFHLDTLKGSEEFWFQVWLSNLFLEISWEEQHPSICVPSLWDYLPGACPALPAIVFRASLPVASMLDAQSHPRHLADFTYPLGWIPVPFPEEMTLALRGTVWNC